MKKLRSQHFITLSLEHLQQKSHISNLRQGQFSAVTFVEFGCGRLVMIGNEIFINANVFFGIQHLSLNNCEGTF